MRVLITGGAGYIGSHLTHHLLSLGHQVMVLDNLSQGFAEALPNHDLLMKGDLLDRAFLDQCFSRPVDVVVHLAALISVKESTEIPDRYFTVNVQGTENLLAAAKKAQVKKFIFASSGSTYGNQTKHRPIREQDPQVPINPYAETKLRGEELFLKEAHSQNLDVVILRFFNVAGSADDLSNGQRTRNAYHLIHRSSQQALHGKPLQIQGLDYETPDGSCIRDYIHVMDLVEIIAEVLGPLTELRGAKILNCGYGHGFSVREILELVRDLAGTGSAILEGPRRPGDPDCLVADNRELVRYLSWGPKRDDIKRIVKSALDWEKSLLRLKR